MRFNPICVAELVVAGALVADGPRVKAARNGIPIKGRSMTVQERLNELARGILGNFEEPIQDALSGPGAYDAGSQRFDPYTVGTHSGRVEWA